MHIIVAHPSPIANTRLQRGLAALEQVTDCQSSSGLTDTYDMAEHTHPDCVVMADDLAAIAEFELLSSLFKIMGIGCVLLGPMEAAAETPSVLRRAGHIARLPADADATTILSAMQTVTRHATRPVAQKAEAETTLRFDPKHIILIGASTGGIDALLKTVPHFSDQCPPTLIVQHTGENFAGSLIRLLNGATAANVVGAEDGAPLKPGHIYLAPHNRAHLCLSSHGSMRCILRPGDLVSGHRPSVDMLFGSARHHARHVAAALLTGMGRDGARGLVELRRAGAQTFGQDAATSVVYGMPRVAMELGGVASRLPLSKIGPALLQASATKARA